MGKTPSHKRNHSETSPEQALQQENKIGYFAVVETNKQTTNMGDAFSWEMFETKMEKMLENVARKEDIQILKQELTSLKNENIELRRELNDIKNKLQIIDQKQRRNNIVVSGLKSKNNLDAKKNLLELCSKVLNNTPLIVRTVEIKSNSDYLFELETAGQVNNILYSSGKLRGSGVFIQRDYTAAERS